MIDNAKTNSGFTLVEMAIVLIIIGIVLSAMVTVLPSLMKSAKIRKNQAILEKIDYAVRGQLLTYQRLPYADSDKDGQADTGVYFGWIPYKDLGLSSGDDVWSRRLKYGVYRDNIDSDICDLIIPAVNDSKLHTIDVDDGTKSQRLYVIVSGGDVTGRFEGNNADDDAAYDDPDRIGTYNGKLVIYNDLMLAGDITSAKGIVCSGGGQVTQGNGSITYSPSEDCTNYVDDDSDGLIDCSDTDCASHPHCVDADKVFISAMSIPPTVIGGSLGPGVIFTAVGGESQPRYNWSLEAVPAALTGMISINTSGELSGTLDICNTATPYSITIRAEDKYPKASTPVADTYDEGDYGLSVVLGNLEITPANTALPDPDFTVDDAAFSRELTVFGDYVGPFITAAAWTLTWGDGDAGDDPGGFEVVANSDTTALFRRTSDLSSAGTFTAKITVVDDSCPDNSAIAFYSVTITAEGATSSVFQGMAGEWRFDECPAWDGVSYDVVDTLGEALHYGRALNGLTAVHGGKFCRAASFDGVDDMVVSTVLTGSEIMAFNDSVTLAAWIKSAGGGKGSPRIIEFSNNTGHYNYSTALVYDTDGSIRAWVTASGTTTRGGSIDYSGELYNDNKWHHLVYTYSSAHGGKLYVDGVLKQTKTDNPTSDIWDAETFSIGGLYNDPAHVYKGLIDEARVFSRELSASDVTDLYETTRASCTGTCYTPPIGQWNMDESLWDTDPGTYEVRDSSSNNLDGTALNAVTTAAGGKVCRMARFTTTDHSVQIPDNSLLDFTGNPFTIAFWYWLEQPSTSNWDQIFVKGTGDTTNRNYAMWMQNGGSGKILTAVSPGNQYFYSNKTLTVGKWYFINAVHENNQLDLFISEPSNPITWDAGRTVAMTGAAGNAYPLYIGASPYPFPALQSRLDQFTLYNRALAENELTALMTASDECPAGTMMISTTSLADGILGSAYSATIEATGGSHPYGWEIVAVSPPIPDLSIITNVDYTATLQGTIDACAGDYTVTIKVTDAAAVLAQKDFNLTVLNGNLSITPAPSGVPPDFICTTSTCYEDFTISGASLGAIGNYGLSWIVSPGANSFELIETGTNSVRLRKYDSSGTGSYSFKITARDGICPANALDSGYYTISISGAGADIPYYNGLLAEWRLDECDWSAAGAVTDYSGNNHHGTAYSGAGTVGTGKVCRAGLTDASGSYLRLNPAVDINDSWSLASWFRWPLSTSGSGWWTLTRGTNDHQILVNRGTNLLGTYDNTSGTNFHDCGFNMSTLTNGWHHLVAVGSGSQTEFYIDGTAVGTASFKSSSNIETLGNYSGGTQNWGGFDEVMLYGRALSGSDVTALYSLNPTCPTTDCYTPPVAEYTMDQNYPWTGTAAEITDTGSGASHGKAALRGSGTLPTQTDSASGKLCRTSVLTRVDANNGGYLDMGDPAGGDLDPGSANWTISTWINWDGSTGENILYNKENLYETRVNGGYVNYAWVPHWVWDGGTSFPVSASTWTYVTILYDGINQVMYKNGIEMYRRSQTGPIGSNSSKLLFGARGNTNPINFFGGMIDEVKIYNRALSENEITADMNETRTCD